MLSAYWEQLQGYWGEARAVCIVYDAEQGPSFDRVRTFWLPEARSELGAHRYWRRGECSHRATRAAGAGGGERNKACSA